MARVIRMFVGVILLAMVATACGKSPTAPEPTPPAPEARDGQIIIRVKPSEECRSAQMKPDNFCNKLVLANETDLWPEGYRLVDALMQPEIKDGKATGWHTISLRAPSSKWAGWLPIGYSDPNLCPPVQVCKAADSASGMNIEVVVGGQHTRLVDGEKSTRFWYEPPLAVRTQ